MQSFVPMIRKLTAKFTLVATFLSPCVILAEPATVEPAPKSASYDLSSAWEVGETQRVAIELEVGGHLTVTNNKQVKKLPMSVNTKQAYLETLLISQQGENAQLRSVRQYESADATIKVENGGLTPKLPDFLRQLVMDINQGRATVFHANEPLEREQLDLVSVVGNSLALSEILPVEPVKIGQSWESDTTAITALLGMDAVAACNVKSELTAVEGNLAKVSMNGTVTGAAEGVATEIELKAKYHFDLSARRISGFNMAVKETRSIGHVGPGLEVIAKLKMQIGKAATPSELPEEQLTELSAIPAEEHSFLLHEAKAAGFRFLGDRRWFATNEADKLLILRFVDRGDLIAQCNLTPLKVPEKADSPLSLEKYQQEVREALGKNFGQFTRAGQWTDAAGQRVYRVIVQGQVDTLPIEWRYYLITHPSGQRVAAVYTIEASLLERFAEADRELVDTLEIRGEKTNSAAAETARQQPTPVQK